MAAALTSVAYYLAMPGPGWWPLAFVGLAPLLISGGRLPAAAAFRQAWVAGFVAWVLTLRWIVPTVRAANEPALVGILGTAALAAYLALYFGAFGWWWAWLRNGGRPGGRRLAVEGRPYSDIGRSALAACGWVVLEAIRARLFTGFPWTPLSLALWGHPLLIQPAGWVGAYGISWMLVFMNAGLATWWDARRRGAWACPVGVVASVMAASVCILARADLNGSLATRVGPYDGNVVRTYGDRQNVRVALLQGNIPQYVKWDARFVSHIRGEYDRLATAAAKAGASLIIWPESALTGFLDSPAEHDWLTALVRRTGAWHLVGAPARAASPGNLLNRAALVRPDGMPAGAYDKVHLVPFGEMVPLQSILGRWIPVLNELGDFSPGAHLAPIQSPAGPLGVTICYEAVFPHLARALAAQGTGALVNITNDAWYLDTDAPHQHFAANVFRALESGAPVLRAANTGITAVIDPQGRVRDRLGLFETGVLVADVTPASGPSFYARAGWVFPWACLVVSVIAVVRRGGPSGPPWAGLNGSLATRAGPYERPEAII